MNSFVESFNAVCGDKQAKKAKLVGEIKSASKPFVAEIKKGNYNSSSTLQMSFTTDYTRKDIDEFVQIFCRGISVFVANDETLTPKQKETLEAKCDLMADYTDYEVGKPLMLKLCWLNKEDTKVVRRFSQKNGLNFKQTCDECRELVATTYKCGGCGVERYCGEACARKAWKEGHKGECKGGYTAKTKKSKASASA
jgi:hypothetical protein